MGDDEGLDPGPTTPEVARIALAIAKAEFKIRGWKAPKPEEQGLTPDTLALFFVPHAHAVLKALRG